jgi:uncharacterized protein YcfL
VGLAAGLVSCRTPSSGVTVESYPSTKITLNSKLVSGRVKVVEYAAVKRNKKLQAQITLQSAVQRDVQFEYRFRWLNSDGMMLDSGLSTWVPTSISAKEKTPINAISASQEAEDFIFEVRFGRPSTRWTK